MIDNKLDTKKYSGLDDPFLYEKDYTVCFPIVENVPSKYSDHAKENNEDKKSLNLKVLHDRMTALITLDLPENLPDFTPDEVKMILDSHGIITGIDEEKIVQLCTQINSKRQPVIKEVIAEGIDSVPGTDAYINYFFNTEAKKCLEEDESGRINFKELNLINNVEEGDLLAEKIPAIHPQSGLNVYGQPVIPSPVKDFDFVPGKNTRKSPDGKQCFSTIAGEVKLEKKMIHVSPVLNIHGDVCLDTGNITFNGSVEIFGDVRSGFSVKAKGDIIVHGMVESADLTAGGNIVIQNGFVAQNKGVIKCRGILSVKYIDQGEVICHGDLIVDSSIMHSNITCFSKLKIPQGKIIGGHAIVVKNLEVGEVGTKLGVPTEITLGDKSIIQQRITEIKSQLIEKQAILNKINSMSHINLDDPREQLDKLSPQLKENLELIIEQKRKATEEYKLLESNLKKLEMLYRQKTNSRLKVYLKIFSNITIIIGHSKIINSDPVTACSYFEDHFDQRIQIGPI